MIPADRRPIVYVLVASVEYVTPANPHGWQESLRGYKSKRVKAPVSYAKALLPHLRDVDAQGILVINGEGAARYNDLGYEGNPAGLADGMDEMAATWRAAGIKVGCTIRHTPIVADERGRAFRVRPDNPASVLIANIAAAKRRGFGDYAYLDSNCDPLVLDVLHAKYLEWVHNAHPDTLLIPEHEGPGYRPWSMPYRQTDNRQHVISPAGGEVISLFWGDAEGAGPDAAHFELLRQALKAGSIPLIRWYGVAPEVAALKRLAAYGE